MEFTGASFALQAAATVWSVRATSPPRFGGRPGSGEGPVQSVGKTRLIERVSEIRWRLETVARVPAGQASFTGRQITREEEFANHGGDGELVSSRRFFRSHFLKNENDIRRQLFLMRRGKSGALDFFFLFLLAIDGIFLAAPFWNRPSTSSSKFTITADRKMKHRSDSVALCDFRLRPRCTRDFSHSLWSFIILVK